MRFKKGTENPKRKLFRPEISQEQDVYAGDVQLLVRTVIFSGESPWWNSSSLVCSSLRQRKKHQGSFPIGVFLFPGDYASVLCFLL